MCRLPIGNRMEYVVRSTNLQPLEVHRARLSPSSQKQCTPTANRLADYWREQAITQARTFDGLMGDLTGFFRFRNKTTKVTKCKSLAIGAGNTE